MKIKTHFFADRGFFMLLPMIGFKYDKNALIAAQNCYELVFSWGKWVGSIEINP